MDIVIPADTAVTDAPVQPPRKSARLSGTPLHPNGAATPQSTAKPKTPGRTPGGAASAKKPAALNRFGFKKRALPVVQVTGSAAGSAGSQAFSPVDLMTPLNETLGDLDEAYAVLKQKQTAPQFEFKAKIDNLQGQVKTLKETLAEQIKRARRVGPEVIAPLQEEVNGTFQKLYEEAGTQRGLADRANEELASVKQRSEERGQKIAELQKQAEIAKKRLQELEAKASSEKSRADVAEASLATRDQELEASEEECRELTAAGEAAAEAASAAAEEASDEIGRLSFELNETSKKLEDTKAAAEKTEADLTAARDGETSRAETAEKSLAATNAELTSLKESHSNLTKEHATTSEGAAGTRAKLEATEAMLEEKRNELSRKETDLREAIQNVSKMQADHSSALQNERNRANGFEEEARELRNKVQLAENAKTLADQETERVRADLDASQKELGHTQSSLTHANSERERLAIETAEQKDSLTSKQSANDSLTKQLAEAQESLAGVTATSTEQGKQIEELSRRKHELEVEFNSYKQHHSSSNQEQMTAISELKLTVDRLGEDLSKKTTENTQATGTLQQQAMSMAMMESKLMEQEALRRALHNQIQELKGNIRVFCRIRPGADAPKAIETSSCGAKLQLSHNSDAHNFSFDKVFGTASGQDDVFREVDGLVQSSLDGYKVCIFAYGQTGSGKTFTMQGGTDPATWGLIPRALSKILQVSEGMRNDGWSWTLTASFLEIYNESLRDLLHDPKSGAAPSYAIKHDEAWGTVVANMGRVEVGSMEQINNLMAKAAKQRAVGCTDMNSQSSRSHSVFALYLKGTNEKLSTELHGALHLVDLAGSERLDKSGATGSALKETQAINKSLSSLADVFTAKAAGNSHVPFRNSKLTHLMEPCLSGHGKTLMMVNVAPEADNSHETLCSLRFAKQVNQCDTASAKGGGAPKKAVSKPGARPATAPPAGAPAAKRK